MLNFNSIITVPITISEFIICVLTALILGILSALIMGVKSSQSRSLALSQALLPPIVAVIIMLVNGNVGAGVAVAGTFALVRFRSVPGSAKEITGLFFSVSLGLACGMGYVGLACVFFVLFSVAALVLGFIHFGDSDGIRILKITIPENLDYEGLFDDLFEKYTSYHELIRVRTTNMGTLYELSYNVRLKKANISKEFIDALRCRNGNLNISCGREIDKDLM